MDNTPSATTPGNPPAGTASGTGLCCACPAEGPVSTDGEGNYFDTNYPPHGATWNYGNMKVTRTASAGTVEFKVKFELVFIDGANEAAHGDLIGRLVHGAMAEWTGQASQVKVEVSQPGCPTQRLRIKFVAEIIGAGAEDAVIMVSDAPLPPSGSLSSYVYEGWEMTFFLNGHDSQQNVMTHEMGHIFGLPDEYASVPGIASPNGDGSVTYGASGVHPAVTFYGTATQQTSEGLGSRTLLLQNARPDADVSGNVYFDMYSQMGHSAIDELYAENFYWVAIEVEKLFAAEGMPLSAQIVES